MHHLLKITQPELLECLQPAQRAAFVAPPRSEGLRPLYIHLSLRCSASPAGSQAGRVLHSIVDLLP